MQIIKSSFIQNYKNINKASITNFKDLNIFIGPNNCGKTSVLRSINKISEIEGAEGAYFSCDDCNRIKSILTDKNKNIKNIKINNINCDVAEGEKYLRTKNITLKYSFYPEFIVDKLKEYFDLDDGQIIDYLENMILQDSSSHEDEKSSFKNHLIKTTKTSPTNEFDERFTFTIKQNGNLLSSQDLSLFSIPEIHEFIKSKIYYIEDNRLQLYNGMDLNEYVRKKNISGIQFTKLIDFLGDIVDPRIIDYKQNTLDLVKKESVKKFGVGELN